MWKWRSLDEAPIGEEVIVSIYDTSGDSVFECTKAGWLTPDREYWIVDNEINNYVIAWMSFPEPAKRLKDRLKELIKSTPKPNTTITTRWEF